MRGGTTRWIRRDAEMVMAVKKRVSSTLMAMSSAFDGSSHGNSSPYLTRWKKIAQTQKKNIVKVLIIHVRVLTNCVRGEYKAVISVEQSGNAI